MLRSMVVVELMSPLMLLLKLLLMSRILLPNWSRQHCIKHQQPN